MSILQRPPQQTPSKEAKLQNTVRRIKTFAADTYDELSRRQKQGIDLVWSHPELTPQEILDKLGSDSVKVAEYHTALTEYIVALAISEGLEPDVKYPTNNFTKNQDGTITVLDEPFTQS
jgi:hypothetical protein